MDKQYNFTFTYVASKSQSTPTTPTTASNIPTTPNANATQETSNAEQFAMGAGKRVAGYVAQQAMAPLNQVTGGMATPVFNLGQSIVTGAGAGAIGGAAVALALQAINLAISKIQERIAKNEAKANEMNERDNLLIKAGVKSYATFYTGNFGGVKSTDRK